MREVLQVVAPGVDEPALAPIALPDRRHRAEDQARRERQPADDHHQGIGTRDEEEHHRAEAGHHRQQVQGPVSVPAPARHLRRRLQGHGAARHFRRGAARSAGDRGRTHR